VVREDKQGGPCGCKEERTMITFNCGIPDFIRMIYVEGYGVCQLRNFYENGDVLLYMGNNRMFRIGGHNRWRSVT
jgi:hypothetical protein